MKTDLAQFRARNLEWLFENETGYQIVPFGHRTLIRKCTYDEFMNVVLKSHLMNKNNA